MSIVRATPDQIAALVDAFAPAFAMLTTERVDELLAMKQYRLVTWLSGGKVIPLKLGDREYELVQAENWETVSAAIVCERAERLEANLGEEDARWFLDHQAEIPAEVREEHSLIFPAWRDSGSSQSRPYVAYLSWRDGVGEKYWGHVFSWRDHPWLVRRVK